jgi:hypothetical protein
MNTETYRSVTRGQTLDALSHFMRELRAIGWNKGELQTVEGALHEAFVEVTGGKW